MQTHTVFLEKETENWPKKIRGNVKVSLPRCVGGYRKIPKISPSNIFNVSAPQTRNAKNRPLTRSSEYKPPRAYTWKFVKQKRYSNTQFFLFDKELLREGGKGGVPITHHVEAQKRVTGQMWLSSTTRKQCIGRIKYVLSVLRCKLSFKCCVWHRVWHRQRRDVPVCIRLEAGAHWPFLHVIIFGTWGAEDIRSPINCQIYMH